MAVLATGHIIPVPKPIINIGKKNAKGCAYRLVVKIAINGPLMSKIDPNISRGLVENRSTIFPTMIFPGTNPKGMKPNSSPICDGDRPYTFAATKGAPTKNIPNIEKLNAETKVGGQKFIDKSSNG